MKKRYLAILCSLCMSIGILFIPAEIRAAAVQEVTDESEAEEELQEGNFYYIVLADGTVSITGYADKESEKEIIVPETIDGKSVTVIGKEVFKQCSAKKITLPHTVAVIGERAFEYCQIKSMYIPDSVRTIEKEAFFACYIEEVTLPKNLTEIREGVFAYSELTDVTIPQSVTTIGKSAFTYCDFKEVEIPDSVTDIGQKAFYGCDKLEKVTFSQNLTRIGNHAFAGCWGLTEIVLPDSVTGIGNYAFLRCLNLKEITVPKSVTSIGNMAFMSNADVLIKCYSGSYAEEYAKERLLNYTLLDVHTHTYQDDGVLKKASTKKNGSITKTCTECGEKEKITVYRPKKVTLSKKSYTYDGKAKKPSVTVLDSKDKKISSDYYTVSYKNNKGVGKATVTVKFKGNYSGTLTQTFTIQPKGTTISKVSAKSKGFSAKWKKQTTQTTGYEIQYSTNKKFTEKTTDKITVKKNETSASISKLKANKKYYVRIRTYKIVKADGKSTKIYSGWSKVSTVTTKK